MAAAQGVHQARTSLKRRHLFFPLGPSADTRAKCPWRQASWHRPALFLLHPRGPGSYPDLNSYPSSVTNLTSTWPPPRVSQLHCQYVQSRCASSQGPQIQGQFCRYPTRERTTAKPSLRASLSSSLSCGWRESICGGGAPPSVTYP